MTCSDTLIAGVVRASAGWSAVRAWDAGGVMISVHRLRRGRATQGGWMTASIVRLTPGEYPGGSRLGALERDQSDGVALGVPDERLPFVVLGWAEAVVLVPEDDVRRRDDVGEPFESLQRVVDVVDVQ